MADGLFVADEAGPALARTDSPDPELPAEAAVDPLPALVSEAIREGVDQVLGAFAQKLAYDQAKQLQIDRLHDELQQHRSNLAARAARPLVSGIIRCHDDVGKLVEALRAKPTETLTPEFFFQKFEDLQDDLEVLLGHNGIETFREPSDTFDPRRQKALRKVPTFDPAQAGKVQATLRPGFEQGAEILEKERVAIYEWVAPLTAADPPTPPPTEEN